MAALPTQQFERNSGDRRYSLVEEGAELFLTGIRCPACGYTGADPNPRCPVCRAETAPASFGCTGRVWSSTIVRIEVQGRQPPYGLAYLDLDEGPRVLVHLDPKSGVRIGDRARIVGLTPDGDCDAIVETRGQ